MSYLAIQKIVHIGSHESCTTYIVPSKLDIYYIGFAGYGIVRID